MRSQTSVVLFTLGMSPVGGRSGGSAGTSMFGRRTSHVVDGHSLQTSLPGLAVLVFVAFGVLHQVLLGQWSSGDGLSGMDGVGGDKKG